MEQGNNAREAGSIDDAINSLLSGLDDEAISKMSFNGVNLGEGGDEGGDNVEKQRGNGDEDSNEYSNEYSNEDSKNEDFSYEK